MGVILLSGWYPSWFDNAMRLSPHVASVVETPPAVEPLTLDQAKLRAGLDWAEGDPRDQLMESFISAARAKVELDTGLSLIQQARAVYLDFLTAPVVNLPMGSMPLQEVTSIDYIDTAGTPHTLDPATYIVDEASGRIALATGSSWPGDVRAFRPWTIHLVAGWPDADALAIAAPLLVHLVGLLVAHYATLGRDLASVTSATDVPHTYCDALASFVPIWVV